MKRLILPVLLTLSVATVVLVRVNREKNRTVYCPNLDENRPLLVHLPPGYRESTESYPVLYLLDADEPRTNGGSSFDTIAKRVDTMSLEGIPPMIVIGIVNTHRSRDMLPIKSAVNPDGGGADRFLVCLSEQIVPYVDGNFRTTGERILYGEADSGLFAINALLENPDLFSGYITSSPTIGHCPTVLRIKAEQLFRERSSLETSLFVIYGDDDLPYAAKFIPLWSRTLRRQAGSEFKMGVDIIPNGGHIPKSSLHDGLLFYFSRGVRH
jgi:predicted alpha/beta superfamily hydrolase